MCEVAKDVQNINRLMIDIFPWPISRENRDKLIVKYLPMVWQVAKKAAKSVGSRLGTEEDCFQEGVIGLMFAIERYKPTHEKGAQFKTYAQACVYRYIQRQANDNGIIRVSVKHLMELVKQNKESREKGDKQLGAADFSLLWPKMFSEIVWKGNKGGDVGYQFEPEAPDTALNQVGKNELHKVVRRAFRLLDPKEQKILNMRFGMDTEVCEPMTLEAIGHQLGISKERVRQLESSAIRKLADSVELQRLVS